LLGHVWQCVCQTHPKKQKKMYFSLCKKNDKPNTILGPAWVQPTRGLGFLAWPRPKNRVQEQKLKNKDQTGSFI